MSQASIVIPSTPPLPGSTLVPLLNDALAALGTNFSGTTDPAANAQPYMTWADLSTGFVKRRNAAGTAWVVIGRILRQRVDAITLGDLPTADVGPVYVAGYGMREWNAALGAYAAAPEFRTLDNSLGFAIAYPNGGSSGSPANIAVNSRYVVPNPFPGFRVHCELELRLGGIWGSPGGNVAVAGTGGGTEYFGCIASQYNDGDLVVQTANNFLISNNPGGSCHPFPAPGVVTSAPARIKCWKVKGALA